MVTGVGDDDGGTVGSVEGGGRGTEGGSIDGVASREAGLGMTMGSGMTTGSLLAASRLKAGTAQRRGRRQRHRGRRRQWRGIEGGGSAEGGKLGQPNGTNQNFTVIGVSRRRGYSPYTRYIIGIG
jgi:hypothetical protein